jgi:hypothetical protein
VLRIPNADGPNDSRRTISAQRIRDLLDSSGRATPSIRQASDLLSGDPPDDVFEVSEVATSELLTIYRRRLRRAQAKSDPLSTDIDFLVSGLSEIDTGTVAMVASVRNGHVIYLWFTHGLDQLIGCVVGLDRRDNDDRS